MPVRVTIWNETLSEADLQQVIENIPAEHREQARAHFLAGDEAVRQIYPGGIHGVLREKLGVETDFTVRTATLDQPDNGLGEEVLAETDVLIWWGHLAHVKVDEATVDRVQRSVLSGMGLIVLHSGHHSKIFRRLMGTTCSLNWRDVGEKTRLWVVAPTHPIAEGIGPFIELEHEEMYGEHFDIPVPDELVFISWYQGGEVFRSGCCWTRGYGRIFYFSPGHETHASFHNPQIIRVLSNAVRWAAPRLARTELGCPNVQPLEVLS